MSDKYLNSTGIATIRDWVKGLIKNNFSNVKVNGTSVGPASSDSAVNFAPGSGISITGAAGTSSSDATITISANISNATTQAAGLMSSSDKTKLDGVESGAEVNQNAFSNVKVGSTTIAADGKTDTLELAAGTNVTLTPDASGDKVTIAATDTTYSNATTQANGLMSSADKTKLDGIDVNANAGYDEIQVDEGVPGWTSLTSTNGKLQLERGANIQLTVVPTAPVPRVNISATDTTYSVAATNADGLMSSSDKTKLNGIESGAEVNQNAFSAVGVGSSSVAHTLSAGSKSAQFNLIIKTGTNDGLSVSNNTATFTVKGTTYSNASTSAAGLMSSSDKTKLNGIATGAEVNVQADWNQTTTTHDAYIKNKPSALSAFTNDCDFLNTTGVQGLIDASITTTYKYKGSVADYAHLPSTGNTTGDVWNVEDTGMNYAWTGSAWDALGSIVDLSAYWATADLVAFTANEVTAILTA